MTKKEFLSKLEKKLDILNSKERKKVLANYEKQIDDLIKEGQSEREAVSSLGSINKIVRKILDSYNINTDYHEQEDFTFTAFFSNLTSKTKEFLTSIFNGSIEELLNLILKVLILLIFIAILHIPFSLIRELVIYLLEFLPKVINDIFIVLWRIFIEFSYIIIAALLIFSNLKSDFKYFKRKDKEDFKLEDDHFLKEFSYNIRKVLKVIYNIFIVIFSVPLLVLFIFAIILVALLITLFSKGVFLIGTIIFTIGMGLLIFSLIILIFNSIKVGDK